MQATPAPEEELVRLLKFATAKKIRGFIGINPSLDLHYPLGESLATPLTAAIERSDPAILSMLITKIPCDLDATLTQPCGRTALMHAACYAGDPEILHVLVKKGADPGRTDINEWNCLFYAVIGKRLRNVAALLDSAEMPIESRDRQGRTPLMISVYLSSLEVFNYLLSRGAEVGALDENGLSALHLAILRRKRECVIELSRRDPIPEHRTPFTGVTARQLLHELMSDVLPTRGSVGTADAQGDDDDDDDFRFSSADYTARIDR